MSDWPPDPTPGMIIEKSPNTYFQYDAKQNTWVRLDGYKSIKLATSLAPGLMSKDDYIKLSSLLKSPPHITISTQDCPATFSTGQLQLTSLDNSVIIENTLDLLNNGEIIKEKWDLHYDTSGINFRINWDKLIQNLEERGNLIKTDIIGDKGPSGEPGDDGIDELDTGPKGEKGDDGSNAPFVGDLRELTGFDIRTDTDRAIVDIDTVSTDDDNYIVATRARVGSPTGVCPSKVNVIDGYSTWAMITSRTIYCGLDCNPDCPTTYYLDIKPLLDAIHERYYYLIAQAKTEKESLVRGWLQTLINLFNEQKSALCCALENCKSRSRNLQLRQHIEEQRIQAAQADFNLIVSNNDSYKKFVNMDIHKDCNDTGGGSVDTESLCEDCVATYEIGGANGQSNPVELDIPAGQYVAEIRECCFKYENGYGADIGIEYNNEGTREELRMPQFGVLTTNTEAQSVYQGLTASFVHSGGTLKAYVLKFGNISNTVTLCIWNAACFSDVEPKFSLEVGSTSYEEWCTMKATQIEWYERGWITSQCIGGLVTIGSENWIIVRRGLLGDVEAGEGEWETTPCVQKFTVDGKLPAIAWQTGDGNTFLGKPTTGSYNFAYDENISEQFRNALLNSPLKTIGDVNDVGIVLIPTSPSTDSDYYTNPSPVIIPGTDVTTYVYKILVLSNIENKYKSELESLIITDSDSVGTASVHYTFEVTVSDSLDGLPFYNGVIIADDASSLANIYSAILSRYAEAGGKICFIGNSIFGLSGVMVPIWAGGGLFDYVNNNDYTYRTVISSIDNPYGSSYNVGDVISIYDENLRLIPVIRKPLAALKLDTADICASFIYDEGYGDIGWSQYAWADSSIYDNPDKWNDLFVRMLARLFIFDEN